MVSRRPLTLLIGALGGQGGGVLTDWLVEAARLAGYPAQATSIPGVAQRTGATTYYFELFPEKNPASYPIFCLFPSQGDVDLVAALEPMEAGKALQQGYVTRTTTVITSINRIYSTAEKSVAGDGTVAAAPVLEALAKAAQRLVEVEGGVAGTQLNAIMFGAVIGCGVLPLSVADGRAAIETKGLAVSGNLAGFERGVELVVKSKQLSVNSKQFTGNGVVYTSPPAGFEDVMGGLPEVLRPLIGHSLARLVDYQDTDYARHYLARLEPVLVADRAAAGEEEDFRLTLAVAQRLAAWMSYEDVIRVAQLKTRPGRLARIREEVGAEADEPLRVTDYLSPGRTELLGVIPASLARRLPKDNGGNGRHYAWPTSTFLGFATLKFLSILKPLRQYTLTFAHEQAVIELWLQAVLATAARDYELALQVAETAVWARGYGEVRTRGLTHLETMLPIWIHKVVADIEIVRSEVTASLHTALHDPDNIGSARIQANGVGTP